MADNGLIRTEAGQERIQSLAFVIGVGVCVLFCGLSVVLKVAESGHSQEIELDTRINPNNAPLGSLVRLPGIGIGRAEAIVGYREDFGRRNGNERAFETIDDLQKVRGIGPKTVQNVSEWLKFE
ncbi:MAG TPA: helix-hairpin-helix domain-containing protein [Sedimentisphaerales bacterium]|nr:helix-hairpin-helix domain-containing protein [Sedimentisphaerales bacterium]